MKVSYIAKTSVLGPGKRCAIWMQGCNKRCKGCINPEGQDLKGGYEISINTLLDKIFSFDEITGVTISGGEPFIQYNELLNLINGIKKSSDLDVMLYSGYTLEEIEKMYPGCMEMLEKVDIFIDGEYIEELNNNSMYRGSSNQNIYCFTKKYADISEQIKNERKRQFAFDIKEDGEVFFIGIPPKDFYGKFLRRLGG